MLLLLPAAYVAPDVARGSGVMQNLIADPSALFAARSPGARGDGALVQSKPAYGPGEPLTAGFAASEPGDILPSPIGNGDQGSEGRGPDLLQSDDPLAFLIPAGAYDAPQAGFYGGGPGGDDGGEFGFGSAGNVPAAPPIPIAPLEMSGAVPEPGSWLMMIGGFMATGAAMRRRNTGAMVISATKPGAADGKP